VGSYFYLACWRDIHRARDANTARAQSARYPQVLDEKRMNFLYLRAGELAKVLLMLPDIVKGALVVEDHHQGSGVLVVA